MISVFYDDTCQQLWVSTRPDPFPPRTLVASLDGDEITITRCVGTNIVVGTTYDMITGQDGTGFADAGSALAYLQGEFAKGPVVGSPERSYSLPPSSGQSAFPLSPQPVDVNTVVLVVNGVSYYPPDTSVSSLAVTWQGPFPFEPTDALRVAYF